MKERPILFSASMVRAILDGSKTMTRRVVKPQPWATARSGHYSPSCPSGSGGRHPPSALFSAADVCEPPWAAPQPVICPFGEPGDRLWVRETHLNWWKKDDANPDGPRVFSHVAAYAADGYELKSGEKWIPSIHMLRAASRITLEVTDVRVERLQNISASDALAEGITYRSMNDPRMEYAQLWDGINAARGFGWDASPWVWSIEFRRIES